MMKRRAPFVKMPGDGRARFSDVELTQSFETVQSQTRASRRQIVNASAQAAGVAGSGNVTGALCCGDAVTGGGTGVGTNPQGASPGTTIPAKVAGLKQNISTVNTTLTQQTSLNSDITLLLSDLYTKTGYTPPIDIPTIGGVGSGS
jgi:hypothetical protein